MHPLIVVSILVLLPSASMSSRWRSRTSGKSYNAIDLKETPQADETKVEPKVEPRGPNVCGPRYRKQCCTGWSRPPTGTHCVIPICIAGCGSGQCIRPNQCLCPGSRRPSAQCESDDQCKGGCLNGGRCIGKDRCACPYGYTGQNCEQDFRTGPCFTQVSNGICRGQLTGVVCTKTLCCSTIGAAWGKPCEQCPSVPHPCRRGFIPNPSTNTCQDVNECQAIPGLCVGGECVNTLGSYRCQCREGQTQNPITNVCEDINECEANPGICKNGQCINTEGSYFCRCDTGYEPTPDKSKCIASQQGFCFTRVSGRNCQGRIAERMSLRDCCCSVDMGKGWSLSGQTCQPCPTVGTDAHSRLCDATNEFKYDYCRNLDNLCENGKCISLEDTFRCECNPGFKNDSQGHCVDIDECSQPGVCRNGQCVNTKGGFECKCNPGFALSKDGTYCTDMNECETAQMCPNGRCVNMDGSYKCVCNPGFRQSANQQICFDINECTENGRLCYNGQCVNTDGSYRCECDEGFQLSPDGAFCLDYDECKRTGMCTNGRCHNMMGSYKCICNPGFQLGPNNQVCLDINECEVNPNMCSHGTCINNQGSFRCDCPQGFVLGPDGRTCLDVRRGLCYPDVQEGRCINPLSRIVSKSGCCCSLTAPGQKYAWGQACEPCPSMEDPQYIQLCPNGPGKDHDGKDINECQQHPDICTHGVCENLQLGYRCICNAGFRIDSSGLRCIDINECEMNPMLCDGGQCRNTPGSYQCICPSGFQFSARTRMCEDLNECEEKNQCIGGDCVNTQGSFKCRCAPGKILDTTERICIDNRQGTCWLNIVNGNCENNLPGQLTQSECCGSIGQAWGSPCAPCPTQSELHCPKGFTFKNGVNCVDINECERIPNICKGGGQCVNTEGSFTCTCPPGLTLDSSKLRCVDLRKSNCYQDYSRMFCSKPFMGSFTKVDCCCSIGQAWGDPCAGCPRVGTDDYKILCAEADPGSGPGSEIIKDINECTMFPGMCVNGRCKNTPGSFECECYPGFAKDSFGTNCTDIDECRISMVDICTPGRCVNEPGTFRCECNEGYKGIMMNQMCVDIDECEDNKSLCRGGSCVNTQGSYECTCPDGHELAPDGQLCKDIDECSSSSSICSNGHCENFMGGYQCICNQGYMPNDLKSMCIDNNECEFDNGACQSVCINMPGSFTCSCGMGYLLLTDGRTCVDVDECKEQPNICDGGRCDNLPGSYRCICPPGLLASPDQKRCLDVDECLQNKNLCQNGGCQNTHGSFVCKCDIGFSVKTQIRATGCTDDDECETGSSGCDENALCINTQGSFKCDCKPGYSGDGLTCRDINECVRDNGGCHRDAACINTAGSFRCICDEGFTGNGLECQDVDECILDPGLCENGQCFNFAGGYRCECDMGLAPTEDERACVDIDECASFPNLCVQGKCENVFGMFRCNCNLGYKLDTSGGNCTDIDECENPDNCQYGICINQQGSYICQCPPNFESNPTGTGCVDKRVGNCYMDVPSYSTGRPGICNDKIAQDVSRATCCCTVGKGWGEIQGFCDPCPKNGSAEAAALCPGGPGFKPNSVTLVLEDIDECTEIEGLCEGGECQNTFGSYVCTCRTGFRLDQQRKRCVDINECLESSNRCGVGRCVNTEGSFQCVCPDGYILMEDGETCMDMRKANCYREYRNATGRFRDIVCTSPLSALQTRFQCCCLFGAAWGEPCSACPAKGSTEFKSLCEEGPIKITDINECEVNPDLCQNGRCIDLPYSFRCECNRGYVYDGIRQICEDDNECAREINPCIGNSQCTNTPGSYKCGCPDGYRLRPDGRRCSDINECEELPGACSNGRCRNLEGSYSCTCNTGFRLSPNKEVCIDIDECEVRPGLCRNGTCFNTEGSFRCHCNSGFTLTQSGECKDIDECVAMIGICTNGRCINTQGSFTCQCPVGYTLSSDKQHCRDVDECSEMDSMCMKGTCQNMDGAFICSCPKGFELAPDKKTCIDINECQTMTDACFGGRCENTEGGFRCICPPGFKVTRDGMGCVDTRSGNCYDGFEFERCVLPRPGTLSKPECCCSEGVAWGVSGQCTQCPLPGEVEFERICPDGIGYTEKGDINECTAKPGICKNGICINTDGSFRCECRPGFVLDATGVNCVDKDECQEKDVCGNGTCTNTVGSFECTCNVGFEAGPHEKCVDINECNTVLNQCAFRCANIPGSFRCVCPMGYKVAADEIHCEDVDECTTPVNKCKYACKNTVGSFLCVCPEGFTQIGQDECRDVDECRQPGVCENGRCYNTQGGYRCDCNTGFERTDDGKACYDRREDFCYLELQGGRCLRTPDLARLTKTACCCSLAVAWGRSCERCPARNSVAFNKLCPHGPGLDKDGKDIDECSSMPGACKNGRCLNTMGSYRCVCDKGYKTDVSGKKCIDINECRQDPKPCEFTCSNTEGSFVCGCPPGYVLNMDGLTCRDLDECTTMRHDCSGTCVNTPGSYTCECEPGYRKTRNNGCEDIDECAENTHTCGPIGQCQNTRGSYQCICPKGYRRDESGKRCIDIDECTDGKCDGECDNVPGSFRCECPPGYTQRPGGQCVDENECNTDYVCGYLALCVNLPGSFDCQCSSGRDFDMNSLNCVDGNACGGHPCLFGCTPSQGGNYVCGCPPGYEPMGQGHCISTASSASTKYPPGVQLPHENTPSTGGKLPPGEGCYQCDHDFGEIPLSRRTRRSTSRLTREAKSLDELIEYYSDSNGIVKDIAAGEGIKKKKSVPHKLKHKKLEQNDVINSTLSNNLIGTNTSDTVIMYILTNQTKPRTKLVKVIPALSVLRHNVRYRIKSGNKEGYFSMHKKKGVSSLYFTKHITEPKIFHLEIECRPVESEEKLGDKVIHLEPYVLHLAIHVVDKQ
ncbi:fibrillin-1-like isoform X1 [Physella acuta]|uniref:fibrillin-1-like isoform X1 n=2 Tax=Physella acuta TaxID=109671 RepID=UPI0027DBBB7A|nr:fibrillin-1-like isoform X1 [Physella acuta]